MVSQRSLCSVAQRVQYLCVMGSQFFRFANTIFLFQRHLENNCLHSRRTQGADESRIHSSTYCSLHSVHEWKKTLLPLPYPFAIELFQTFPLGFLVRTALHCPTQSYGVQSRHFSIRILICCVLLLSLFPLLSSVPFTFLTSFWYSFCCCYCVSLFHFNLLSSPFYASFPWEKGGVPL